MVRSADWGWLWYAETGYMKEIGKDCSVSVYMRGEFYRIENWDDRIYVYERDAPGTFNVPAYYGKGNNLSLVAAVKYKRHSWHIRASTSVREIKLQYSFSL